MFYEFLDREEKEVLIIFVFPRLGGTSLILSSVGLELVFVLSILILRRQFSKEALDQGIVKLVD